MTANGTICILLSSTQLGVIRRIIFIFCWWIAIINILLLYNLYVVAKSEFKFEKEKHLLDEGRKECEICKIRHTVIMVHGVFFRDTRYFNYWGRIPKELKKNGAVSDLTAKNCVEINKVAEDCPGVVYQSITSRLNSWRGAKFPLNISYLLAKRFDGDNDGLVSVESAKWGKFM